MAGTNNVIKYETSFGPVELSTETVKKYLVRGNGNVSEQEIMLFLKLCEAQKLNPFVNGEVYLIKYGNQPANMVVGYDTYKRRAEEHPEFMYKESGIVVRRGNDIVKKDGACLYPGEELLGGWCRVHKWKYERDIAIYKECAFVEYNKGNAVWKEKPAMMIEKVAISQALRESFPKDFQGLYTPEEIAPKDFKPQDLEREPFEEKVAEVVENSEPENRLINNDERKELFRIAVELFGSQDEAANRVRNVLEDFGIETTKDMTLAEYKDVIEALKEYAEEIKAQAEAAVEEADKSTDEVV